MPRTRSERCCRAAKRSAPRRRRQLDMCISHQLLDASALINLQPLPSPRRRSMPHWCGALRRARPAAVLQLLADRGEDRVSIGITTAPPANDPETPVIMVALAPASRRSGAVTAACCRRAPWLLASYTLPGRFLQWVAVRSEGNDAIVGADQESTYQSGRRHDYGAGYFIYVCGDERLSRHFWKLCRIWWHG